MTFTQPWGQGLESQDPSPLYSEFCSRVKKVKSPCFTSVAQNSHLTNKLEADRALILPFPLSPSVPRFTDNQSYSKLHGKERCPVAHKAAQEPTAAILFALKECFHKMQSIFNFANGKEGVRKNSFVVVCKQIKKSGLASKSSFHLYFA